MYFLIEDDNLLEKIILFGIKSALLASLSIIKNFLKTKIKSYCDEVTNFYKKKITKVDSNHTCLAVINFDCALKKDENY